MKEKDEKDFISLSDQPVQKGGEGSLKKKKKTLLGLHHLGIC